MTGIPRTGDAPSPAAGSREGLRQALLGASGKPAAPFVGSWGRVSSTNDIAKAVAADAGKARCGGSVVVAESQTAGRGRFGRNWMSPPGGLYLSILVEPLGAVAGRPPDSFGLLPLAAGVAVARAVRAASGASAELRWPNDLDWEGRKVAGVLAETGFLSDRPYLAVVGFGVNLRPVPAPSGTKRDSGDAARPPGWLPEGVDRTDLAASLVASFREMVRILEEEPAAVFGIWESFSPTARGCRCELQLAGGRRAAGTTLGLDRTGALRVQLDGAGVQVVTDSDALRIVHAPPRPPPPAPEAQAAAR